ncbi:MAG: sensor histidine kinase, partial [Endomicrobiales bacterium]
ILSSFSSDPALSVLLAAQEKSMPFTLSRSGGKTLFLEGVSTKILDSGGQVPGYILIFRDVTLEKKESQLKRNFLSLVSHKLKTPLVAITGYGPLLLSDGSLTGFQKKAVQSITRQGTCLASLVDKLLTFALLESGHVALEKAEQPFPPVLERALSQLKQYLEERGARVDVTPRVKELPKVFMDGEKMEAVLRNLIENAVKFNPGAEKTVTIDACGGEGFAGLSVKDNGPGIPPEEREKIFQKFYQIEESFTGQVEGAGLGLALVRQTVEAHGGKVLLESAMGGGSTFSVLIPA